MLNVLVVMKLDKLFGFRTMENGNKIPQSYCKVCRSKK